MVANQRAASRGWSCVGVRDEGEALHICEMCETQPVRYVHTMRHPDYADALDVGCICAGHMEANRVAARLREEQFKQIEMRRHRWLLRKWRLSHSGNAFLNCDGFHIVVFERQGFWGGCVEHRETGEKVFSQRRYGSADAVKLAAFEAMVMMKYKIGDRTHGVVVDRLSA